VSNEFYYQMNIKLTYITISLIIIKITIVVGWLVAAPLFFTSFLMPRALAYLDTYIPEYERAF